MSLGFNILQILRKLRKSPLFTTIGISCLAFGIGANTAIFSVIEVLFLRSLPVSQPSRLVSIARMGPNNRNLEFSYPIYTEIRDTQKVLVGTFAFWDAVFNVQTSETSPLRLADVVAVTDNYYSSLGIRPFIGRMIGSEEGHGESSINVAVISYGYWRQSYGGDSEIVGKSVRIEGVPFTIIGVAPKDFLGLRLGTAADVTVPLAGISLFTGKRDGNPQRLLNNRKAFWLTVMSRLNKGSSITQARAQLEAIWPSIVANTIPEDLQPEQRASFLSARIQVTSGRTGFSYLRDEFSRSLFILMGLAAVMLLFTCTTLANLMLARVAGRKYDIAVRIALGARPSSIVLYLTAEAVVISLCATLVGLIFAYWTSPLLARFVWTGNLPLSLNLIPNSTILLFATAIGLATGLGFSIFPAWSIARQQPALVIRQKHEDKLGWRAGLGLGKILTGTQLALSIILLVGAALLTRGLSALSSSNPGFMTDGVIVSWLTPKPGGYRNLELPSYYRRLLDNIIQQPGVRSASLSNPQPLGYEWRETVSTKRTTSSSFEEVSVDFCMVSPDFFRTMGIPLLQGRNFTLHDDDHAPRVAILSESLAGRLFKSADAIGGRIRIGDQPEHQNIEVLAIVGDANLWNIRAKRPATVYVPFFQEPQLMGRPVLEVQTLGDPKAVESNLLSSIQSLGHEYPFRTETIAESIQKSLVQERLAALLGKCLAGLAVFLAVIGVYGLFSYTVLLQTHDIGIRIALGASRRNVVRLILLDVLRIVPIGIGAGLAASAFLSRFITGLLLGLSPLDFASYLITTVLLVATAIVAAYIPARRASRIDPLLALRTE